MSGVLSSVVQTLSKIAPAFPLRASQIRILHEPREFYDALLTGIQSAKRRILIASLYLGTGKLEQQLVDSLLSKARLASDRPEIMLLFDYFRSTRGQPRSSVDFLRKTIESGAVACYLYATPRLRHDSYLQHIFPEKLKECIGVQHSKFAVFDDQVLITGEQYFANRVDRYHVVTDCSQLADFFASLFTIFSAMSVYVSPKMKLIRPHSSESSRSGNSHAKRSLHDLVDGHNGRHPPAVLEGYDTFLFPTIQLGPLGIDQDLRFFEEMLCLLEEHAAPKVLFSSGYMNLYSKLIEGIKRSSSAWSLVTASPEANSFFKARGASRLIPALYRAKEIAFLKTVSLCAPKKQLFEFSRPGWAFHAKGLLAKTLSGPVFSAIGSSNYGTRSYKHDLEAQTYLVSTSEQLALALERVLKRAILGL